MGLKGDTEIQTAKGLNRIRKQGAGSRFVHGGSMPQEVVIPVLHVNIKKKQGISEVSVDILNRKSRITTNNQTISFYQSEPVTDKMKGVDMRFGFYDKDGNLIDLSTRKNSPTSLNQYSPILTDEEAAQFTLRNVLGGSDSWDAISETKLCAAPEQVTIQENTLSWQAVADARCYVIFKNGEYMGNTTSTSFTIDGAGNYAVCAANKNGGLGIKANAYLVTTNAAGWASFCAAENTSKS